MKLSNEQVTFLADNKAGNDFYTSLHQQFIRKGELSEKQVACIERAMKPKAAPKPAVATDAAPIFAMFAAASVHLKKPRLSFQMADSKIVISKAPETLANGLPGKNAGCLYVKVDGEYFGKVNPAGELFGSNVTPFSADQTVALQAQVSDILSDPQGAVLRVGKQSGTCCCCGRELTEAESIVSGVGPVCGPRWGIERVGREKALEVLADQNDAARAVVEGIADRHAQQALNDIDTDARGVEDNAPF